MAVKGDVADKERKPDPIFGRRGKNDNYPGSTETFVAKLRKRRAKNKAAKKSRKANRK